MLNIFLDAIIIFLLIYALYSISSKIASFASGEDNFKNLHAVITPKDSEDFEYVIRCAASKCKRAGFSLFIIDLGLSENSKYIAEALKNEFSNISLLTLEEYIKEFL